MHTTPRLVLCMCVDVYVNGIGCKVVSVDHHNATATHLDGGIESVPSRGILLLSLLEATVVGLADLMYAANRSSDLILKISDHVE